MEKQMDLIPQEAEVDELFKIERRGMEPVLEAERHGAPRELAFVWAGAMVNYVSLLTGALVIGAPLVVGVSGGQLGLLDCAVAIIVGAGLAALLHGLLSVTGARTGTPQMIFARGVFGHRGAYPAAALTWLMATGWFAVDCIIGGWALVQLLGIFGVAKTTGVALGAITLVLLASVVVATYGHQTIHVFEKYGSMVFVAFCVLLFVFLLPKMHWGLATTVHGWPRLSALVVGGSFIYALVASWIPFASDYSRYMPRQASARRIAWWSGLGIGLPTAVLGIFGVALYTINPANPDLLSTIAAASPPWLTVPFLLFVVLGEIWANYFDVYTAGLVALAMDIPLRRWLSALLCGIVGGACMYGIALFSRFNQAQTYTNLTTNFLGFYTDFLLLTYLWVPAWAAVLLIDFFIFRRGDYVADQLTAGRGGLYWYRQGVFWRAVIAWLVGVVVTIPFIGSATLPWLATPWQGPFARLLGGMDLSGIIGAVVSGVLYYLLAHGYFRQHARASYIDSLEG
ncbi:cytosine permease [Ktedonobacteria bacterium brp13]|nr:cytosine permease [Ktedonobacteria bacterium brp13]